jgi:hypothetical protein
MLNRLDVTARNKASKAAVRRLQERLDARQAVSRAAGILAEIKHFSYERTLVLLLRQARESRQLPLATARTIMLCAEIGHLVAPGTFAVKR